jgi:hypothetical protein
MASKKHTIAESCASVYAAVTADLAKVPQNTIVSDIAEGADRSVIAYCGIGCY